MSEFINTIDLLGDDAVIDSIINRTITEFKDDKLTSIGTDAFHNCTALVEVDLPNVTSTGDSMFSGCIALTTVNMPLIIQLEGSAFRECSALITANFPKVTYLAKGHTFRSCKSLTTAILPKLTNTATGYEFNGCSSLVLADTSLQKIRMQAFGGDTSLKALLLRGATVCTLDNTSAFTNTPIVSGTGYIYVPRALIEDYKVATNWSTHAAQFRALEDYTLGGTVDGLFIGEDLTSVYDISLISIPASAFENHPALEEATFTNATTVGGRAFANCAALTDVDLPNVTSLADNVFLNCTSLKNVSLPECTHLRNQIFSGCTSLEEISLPKLTSVYGSQFNGCTSLKKIHFPELTNLDADMFINTALETVCFPKVTSAGARIFQNTPLRIADFHSRVDFTANTFYVCPKLIALVLRGTDAISTAANTYLFSGNWSGTNGPIMNGTGFIYVPRALIDSYKADAVWSTWASQFRVLEDYTVDGTTTGEFDLATFHDVTDIVLRTIAGDYVNTTVTKLRPYALRACAALTSVKFTKVTSVGDNALSNCTILTRCDFAVVTEIGPSAFTSSPVGTLILRNSASVCSLSNTNAFGSTNIANGTGYIYVPSALVSSYKAATNWSTYANQIRAIEDYPDICGGE